LNALKEAQEAQSLQSLTQEKQRNKKLKDKASKLAESHHQEKGKLQGQIDEYKETVRKQADLIS